MRFDFTGKSEPVECDKGVIIERAGIPARDLRILGPVFSHSSNILGKLTFLVNCYLFSDPSVVSFIDMICCFCESLICV